MKKTTLLLALPSILALVSCGGGAAPVESSSSVNEEVANTLEKFQKGFRLEGTISSLKTFYADSNYDVPSSKESESNKYSFTLVYQNSDSYTGIDRRYYRESGNEKKYLGGENAYNDNGYVGLNYVDYYNNLQTDGYSSNDGYNQDPYASSGLLNPFTFLKAEDFTVSESKITLNASKNDVIYNQIFSGLSKYVDLKVPLKEGVFSSDFTSYTSESVEYEGTTFEDYTNYYSKTKYAIAMNFYEIGTANSKNALQPEPVKSENSALGKALLNMMGKTITVTRHSITYSAGEKIESEETVATYNDGTDIYMQVYDYALTPIAPAQPSASDLYLKANANKTLATYVFNQKNSDGSYSFYHDTYNYSSLDGYYYYSQFQPIFNMSQNIFNKNEDGSYSPTEDNLPYIGAECFVPAIASTTEISNGYVTSLKIYLSSDESYIDHIQFLFEESIYTGYTGEIIVSYSDVGTTKMPFNIAVA